jgi:hypothetical protein
VGFDFAHPESPSGSICVYIDRLLAFARNDQLRPGAARPGGSKPDNEPGARRAPEPPAGALHRERRPCLANVKRFYFHYNEIVDPQILPTENASRIEEMVNNALQKETKDKVRRILIGSFRKYEECFQFNSSKLISGISIPQNPQILQYPKIPKSLGKTRGRWDWSMG